MRSGPSGQNGGAHLKRPRVPDDAIEDMTSSCRALPALLLAVLLAWPAAAPAAGTCAVALLCPAEPGPAGPAPALPGVAEVLRPAPPILPPGFDALSADAPAVPAERQTAARVRIGGPGPDRVRGSAKADVLRGRNGPDRLYGRGGDDELYGETGADRLVGGSGNDWLEGSSGDDVMLGQSGDDVIVGGFGHDRAQGGSGDDVINTGAAEDRIDGGSGNDTLHGGSGGDLVRGGSGDDWVFGDSGPDRLYGGPGNDTVFANDGGRDLLIDCGPGEDTVVMDPVSSRGGISDRQLRRAGLVRGCEHVTFAPAAARDPAKGITWIGPLTGATRHGTDRHDTLLGAHGPDRIYGEGGDDVIWANRLHGDRSTALDRVWAGPGNDTVYGSRDAT